MYLVKMQQNLIKFTTNINMSEREISIIIPAYNEEGNISELYNRLCLVLEGIPSIRFNLLFIDDGSTDATFAGITEIADRDERVNYISLSRNFGHQNALKAGIDHGKGDAIISMDADLQHPPELIPEMIARWESGSSIVNTRRLDTREQSQGKKRSARLFYRIINRLIDFRIEYGTADYRLLDAAVAAELRKLNEAHPFYRGLVPWMGFPQSTVDYEPGTRFSGKTKYSFRKMMSFAMAGVTSFSTKPLRISIIIGIILAVLCLAYAVYAIYIGLFTDRDVAGWTSVIVSVLFIGSLQLVILGIIGEYLGKLFMENKRRPNYIIHESRL